MATIEYSKRIDSSNDGSRYNVSVNGYDPFILKYSPFGNCQVFGIKYFNSLVYALSETNELNQIESVLREIKMKCGYDKTLLMVDINKDIYDEISDYLTFTLVAPYVSSNKSEMVVCIIDLSSKGDN